MSTVDLRRVEYFVAVAEERHFGRAADRLRIAQPGLSQQIRALERSLRVQLFIRGSRGVELTEAGATFLAHARVLIEAADRAVEAVRDAPGRPSGFIRVGTHVMGSPPFVNEILASFESTFPDIRLETRPSLALQALDALGRREVDVAIVPAPIPPIRDLRYLRIAEIEVLVALSDDHRLARLDRIPREELARETVLVWPRNVNPTLVDHFRRSLLGDTSHPAFVELAEMTDGARLQAVADGRGTTMMAATAVPDTVPGVVFRSVEDPAPTMEMGLAWFDVNASPFVPSFVELARELSGSPG